jgi:hypothetical protein
MDCRVKPGNDAEMGPGSAVHRFAKSYALRCVRGTEEISTSFTPCFTPAHIAAPGRVFMSIPRRIAFGPYA